MWISKKRFEELEGKVERIEQTHCGIVEFLSKHNKDDLVYDNGLRKYSSFIKYIYNGELNFCEIPYSSCTIKPLKNDVGSAVIEITTHIDNKYIWKLDKVRNVIVDITSEYKD